MRSFVEKSKAETMRENLCKLRARIGLTSEFNKLETDTEKRAQAIMSPRCDFGVSAWAEDAQSQ